MRHDTGQAMLHMFAHYQSLGKVVNLDQKKLKEFTQRESKTFRKIMIKTQPEDSFTQAIFIEFIQSCIYHCIDLQSQFDQPASTNKKKVNKLREF